MFCHFLRAMPGVDDVRMVLGGGELAMLAEGLQGVLSDLGAAPYDECTDNLSEASRNLHKVEPGNKTCR